MKLSFKIPFAGTIALMAGALGWMLWEGWYVVVWRFFGYLVSGAAFTKFVFHGTVGDSYQCAIMKVMLIGASFSAALIPAIAVLFPMTDLDSKWKKRAFAAFGFALCLLPFSGFGLAVLFISRCIAGMGVTPNRLLVLGCGLAGMLIIGAFCYWIARTPCQKEE